MATEAKFVPEAAAEERVRRWSSGVAEGRGNEEVRVDHIDDHWWTTPDNTVPESKAEPPAAAGVLRECVGVLVLVLAVDREDHSDVDHSDSGMGTREDDIGAVLGLAFVSGAEPWVLALVSAARPAREDEGPSPAPSPVRRCKGAGGSMRLLPSELAVLSVPAVVLSTLLRSVVAVELAEALTVGNSCCCCGCCCSDNGVSIINDDDERVRLPPSLLLRLLCLLLPVAAVGGTAMVGVRVGRVGTEVGCTDGCRTVE